MTHSTRWFLVTGLAVALLLAFGASRYASAEPDGLQKVATDHAIDAHERPHTFNDAPLAGYQTRGVSNRRLSRGVSGVLGVTATFAVVAGLVWLVGKRQQSEDDTTPPGEVTAPRATGDRLPSP